MSSVSAADGVPEPRLDGLDALAVPDQQRGVVVPKACIPVPAGSPTCARDRPPDVTERRPGDRLAVEREDQPVSPAGWRPGGRPGRRRRPAAAGSCGRSPRVFGGPNSVACSATRHELTVHVAPRGAGSRSGRRSGPALALAHARAGGERDQRPQLVRHRLAQRLDLLGRQRDDLRFRSTRGSRVPSHGLATILRSRTAAFMTADTTPWTTPIVAGASGLRFALVTRCRAA